MFMERFMDVRPAKLGKEAQELCTVPSSCLCARLMPKNCVPLAAGGPEHDTPAQLQGEAVVLAFQPEGAKLNALLNVSRSPARSPADSGP